jgi:intracellular multiplication protein IcmK
MFKPRFMFRFMVPTVMAVGLLLSAAAAQAQQVPGTTGDGLDEFVTPQTTENDPSRMVNDMAFQSTLDSAMPLRPDQIQQLIARMSELQRVTAPALADPVRPRPTMKVETISLDPSGTPPVIKVAAGYVTSIMMMDATGAPWEIEDIAYAGKFDVRVAQNSGHIFRIIPMSRFYEGNLTVQLRGLAAPIAFRLVAESDEVYYRFDVRVPAMGPNARPPRFTSANSLAAGDSVMMAVLDGYPPANAKRLTVRGLDDRTGAWEVNGQVYLRTPHSLLSPAWSASTSSGDGTTVYAIPDSPVLLLSDQGVMVRARLTRPEGITAGDSTNGN